MALNVLTPEQATAYHERGYVLVENAVSDDWLHRLRQASDEFVEESRGLQTVSYTHLTLPTICSV